MVVEDFLEAIAGGVLGQGEQQGSADKSTVYLSKGKQKRL